jgi:hypothetical protein
MGYTTALDLAQSLDLETAVTVHLRSNCYPPVPLAMVQPALEAIEACSAEDPYSLVPLPDGVSFRDGRTEVEASQIVTSLRLEAFVTRDND